MGLQFQTANQMGLSFSFEHCILDHSTFYTTKIKQTKFSCSSLKEVDFTQCDLSSSIFAQCDLLNATFDQSILEKVDFMTAVNYQFDLDQNKVKGSKHRSEEVKHLVAKYNLIIN